MHSSGYFQVILLVTALFNGIHFDIFNQKHAVLTSQDTFKYNNKFNVYQKTNTRPYKPSIFSHRR